MASRKPAGSRSALYHVRQAPAHHAITGGDGSENGANEFIFYGKGGEIATNRLDEQELAVLALHLLQISLVYVNTLMIQRVLGEPNWQVSLGWRIGALSVRSSTAT